MRLPTAVTRPAVLNSITAASPSLAWAVGTENLSGGARPLLLHWNGRRWIKDAVPVRRADGEMVQVSSASRRTAWALGYHSSGAAVILHWVSGAWVRVPAPSGLSPVNSIAGGTDGSAWLAGYNSSLGYLLEHWSRGRWQTIKVPQNLWGGMADMLAVGSDNLWISDYTVAGQGIVVHYDAGTWSSTSAVPGGVAFVTDVLAVSPQRVWITGWLCTAIGPPGCASTQPLIGHWNGSAWDKVLHPAGIGSTTSISPSRTGQPQWAGVTASGTGERLFYEHFDGTRWSLRSAAILVPGAVSSSTDVAAVPGTNATWAVASSQTSATSPGVTVIQYNPGS
ncbi:MAG TPA: hypothetical protein VF834_01700 [Streptosporangiaceae bacterium]